MNFEICSSLYEFHLLIFSVSGVSVFSSYSADTGHIRSDLRLQPQAQQPQMPRSAPFFSPDVSLSLFEICSSLYEFHLLIFSVSGVSVFSSYSADTGHIRSDLRLRPQAQPPQMPRSAPFFSPDISLSLVPLSQP